MSDAERLKAENEILRNEQCLHEDPQSYDDENGWPHCKIEDDRDRLRTVVAALLEAANHAQGILNPLSGFLKKAHRREKKHLAVERVRDMLKAAIAKAKGKAEEEGG